MWKSISILGTNYEEKVNPIRTPFPVSSVLGFSGESVNQEELSSGADVPYLGNKAAFLSLHQGPLPFIRKKKRLSTNSVSCGESYGFSLMIPLNFYSIFCT